MIVIAALRKFAATLVGITYSLLDIVVESVFVATFDGLLYCWVVPKAFHGWQAITGEDIVRPYILSRRYDILEFLEAD